MNAVARIALATAALTVVACSALFEDPVQCKTDADCTQFAGTVCGASGMCEAPSGGATSVTPTGSAATSAPSAAPPAGSTATPAPVCPDIGARPSQPLPGAADGGTTTELTANVALDCNTTTVLRGTTRIGPGATLTIGPGTWIKAEDGAALVVLPGGKLVATGTKDLPVVFTAAAAQPTPGAWRGVVLYGKAPPQGNAGDIAYGGDAVDDASGTLSYVRVEYATRGLELFSVGRGTAVDGVMVRKTAEANNCFTFNGGRVDVRHLACQYAADEMFEFTNGYEGRAQFLAGQRIATEGRGHHGLLVDNSKLTAANITLCGADQTNQGNGLLLRNNASPAIANVAVVGFGAGFDVSGGRGTPFELRRATFFGNAENVAFEEGGSGDPQSPLFDDDQGFDERAFFADGARGNVTTDPGLAACLGAAAPSFVPGAPGAGETLPADGFFDATATFVGAVKDGASDWTKEPWLRWAAD